MWRLFLVLIALALSGCGAAPVEEDESQVVGPSAKVVLSEIIRTGELSGETSIEEEIDKIRATDPKRATDLAKEYARLINLEESDQIIQQAQRMLAMFK